MKFIAARDFPTPSQHGREVENTKLGPWAKAVVFGYSAFLLYLGLCRLESQNLVMGVWTYIAYTFFLTAISLPIHEILHLLAHPGHGFSEYTKFGLGKVGGIPFAPWVGYADWMPRKRAILINILPFCVLALLAPIGSYLVGSEIWTILFFVGGANAIGSRTDILNSIALMQSKSNSIFESERGFFEEA